MSEDWLHFALVAQRRGDDFKNRTGVGASPTESSFAHVAQCRGNRFKSDSVRVRVLPWAFFREGRPDKGLGEFAKLHELEKGLRGGTAAFLHSLNARLVQKKNEWFTPTGRGSVTFTGHHFPSRSLTVRTASLYLVSL